MACCGEIANRFSFRLALSESLLCISVRCSLLTGPKSLASEIAALQSLRAHYLELLAAYPTSVEQDDEV